MFKKDHFAKYKVYQENQDDNIKPLKCMKKLSDLDKSSLNDDSDQNDDDDKTLNDSNESENETNKSDDNSEDKKSHSDDSDNNEDTDDDDSNDNHKSKNKVDDDDSEDEKSHSDDSDNNEDDDDDDDRKGNHKRKNKIDDDKDDYKDKDDDDSENDDSSGKDYFQKKIQYIQRQYFNIVKNGKQQKDKNSPNNKRKGSNYNPPKKSESESDDESSEDRHSKSPERTGQNNSKRNKERPNTNNRGSKRPFYRHNANNNCRNSNNNGRNSHNNYRHHYGDNSNSRYNSSNNDSYRNPYNQMYSDVDRTSELSVNNKDEKGRKMIASQTCSIIQKGEYEFKNEDGTFETIDISDELSEMIKGTRTYYPDFFTDVVLNNEMKPEMCQIKIEALTSYGSAYGLYHQNQKKKVCVLNFASATKPGGGFIEGRQAQEEALSRQSALYASLYTQPKMYAYHKNDYNYYYYSDYMIYSPSVPVFRDDKKENLLSKKDLFYASVITSAAPYLKKVKEKSRDFDRRYKSYYERLVLKRIRKIVKLAIYKGNDALVLGAYGCGVFENDPKVISKAFKTVLIDEGFGRYLDIVTFPVMNLSSNNGRVFIEEFKDYIE